MLQTTPSELQKIKLGYDKTPAGCRLPGAGGGGGPEGDAFCGGHHRWEWGTGKTVQSRCQGHVGDTGTDIAVLDPSLCLGIPCGWGDTVGLSLELNCRLDFWFFEVVWAGVSEGELLSSSGLLPSGGGCIVGTRTSPTSFALSWISFVDGFTSSLFVVAWWPGGGCGGHTVLLSE